MLAQYFAWPGVKGIVAFEAHTAHGLTPGIAIVTTVPQDNKVVVAAQGDLAFGDGVHQTVVWRDCRVARMTAEMGPEGTTYTLEIQDRRWRWLGFNATSGSYNLMDNRRKLVPWSIRSPMELAAQCLADAGELNAEIDLPPGLTSAVGKDINRYLLTGERFPQTLSNPETLWDHSPPMEMLARLADRYGRRIIFQPIFDRVMVALPGNGKALPNAPCEVIAPGLELPKLPAAVAVAGAPVRIQYKFALEAVGKEWDGSYLPINQLSYAPTLENSQKQITVCTYDGSGDPSALIINITLNPGAMNADTRQFLTTTATVAAKTSDLEGKINADANVTDILKATSTATTVTLTGKIEGVVFGVQTDEIDLPDGDTWTANTTQVAVPKGKKTWAYCQPPDFLTVKATDRLSFSEAQALAQESVFRCYRLLNIDVQDGLYPIKLPWYRGKIVRRQQIILQSTKVEQVVPAPRREGLRDRDNPIIAGIQLPIPFPLPNIAIQPLALGVLPEFFDGFSRDQDAVVRGSVYKQLGSVMWDSTGILNTKTNDRVYVGFDVDPFFQLVKFKGYVYKWIGAGGDGFVQAASLVLETACNVTDANTGQIVRWEAQLPLGGTAPVEWQVREDIAVGIVGIFPDPDPSADPTVVPFNRPRGWKYATGDYEDMKGRSGYYLTGMAAKYQTPAAEMCRYAGILPIDPDGAIQQVHWMLGPEGPTTIASLNTEFSVAVPPYVERRRAENLPPNQMSALTNILERSLWPMKSPQNLKG